MLRLLCYTCNAMYSKLAGMTVRGAGPAGMMMRCDGCCAAAGLCLGCSSVVGCDRARGSQLRGFALPGASLHAPAAASAQRCT